MTLTIHEIMAQISAAKDHRKMVVLVGAAEHQVIRQQIASDFGFDMGVAKRFFYMDCECLVVQLPSYFQLCVSALDGA